LDRFAGVPAELKLVESVDPICFQDKSRACGVHIDPRKCIINGQLVEGTLFSCPAEVKEAQDKIFWPRLQLTLDRVEPEQSTLQICCLTIIEVVYISNNLYARECALIDCS
jgi:hypothetical protein